MSSSEPLIVKVLQSYFPDWQPPKDTGREWYSVRCPFHGDTRPSASVSYSNNAFRCFACGEKGSAIGIITRKEGISYREAIEYAEELSPGSNALIQHKSNGKSRRRVFGESGPGAGRDNAVSPGVRRRTTPWS